MSLKSELNNLIREKGQVSIQEVYSYCYEHGYKQSNAERRLRQSESPDIQPIYSDKGHIKGYKWKDRFTKELTSSVVDRINFLSAQMEAERVENRQQTLL